MFGANKQKNPSEGCPDNNLSLNLDRDMLEGLKSLFQAHRDYLYYLVKEMGIDTSDEKGLHLFISFLIIVIFRGHWSVIFDCFAPII